MELGYQKLPDIPSQNNGRNFHTGDEISYINYLKQCNPTTAVKYCRLITSGMRRYDKGVDMGRVVKFAYATLAELVGAVPTCQ